jgi:hypothetical protein
MHSNSLILSLCLVLALLVGGCVAGAKEQFAKIETGMSKQQVAQVLGDPEKVKYVRFAGHDRDYEIWQYAMVPNTPLCPSEAVPRFATAMVTVGLSEIVWTRAKADPHWIYFLDDSLVYTSQAFDCAVGDFCKVQRGKEERSSTN